MAGSRTARKRQGSGVYVAMIAGSIAVIVTVGVLLFFNQSPSLDTATLCPLGKSIENSVVVLVDTTDELNQLQRSQLLAAVADEQDRIPKYAKLTLLFLQSETPFEPEVVLSLCNPGSPWAINRLFETESHVQELWQGSFGGPLEAAVAKLAVAPSSQSSPIMEAITAATWRPDFDGRVPVRRLVLVSDLLQFIPDVLDHYAGGDLDAAFERSGLGSKVEADLSNADIVVYYLRRPRALAAQTREHREFWRRWLLERGANTVEFRGAGS